MAEAITVEALHALTNATLTPPCNWHAHGDTAGCGDKAQAGEYVVVTHPHTDTIADTFVLVICETRQRWLLANWHSTVGCSTCADRFAICDVFELRGALSELQP